jgi:pimeloyl-ACP methyl ester carboxylesterase
MAHRGWYLFLLLLCGSARAYSQSHDFNDRFSEQFDCHIEQRANNNFKEFYEITFTQPVDHAAPRKKFEQRVFVGFQNFNAPTVMVADGYAIDYALRPDFTNELATEFKANMVVVEHRFFGKSVPAKSNWNVLTVKQAADDDHAIRLMLGKLFKGKWLSSGVSKGGQAALAYKLFYPADVAATVVYGAAVKSKQTVFADDLLANLSQLACGKKICGLQHFLFGHKALFLTYFNSFVAGQHLDFSPLSNESVLDYMLLEMPFSFWQNGHICGEIPDTTITGGALADYLFKLVPPRFFSSANKKILEPAFYMFYHELGYYEYNTKPFRKYLGGRRYSNRQFAPNLKTISFDDRYQKRISAFLKSSNAASVFFIFGQNDTWALQSAKTKNLFTVPAGSHKSRIVDFPLPQKAEIYTAIRAYLD